MPSFIVRSRVIAETTEEAERIALAGDGAKWAEVIDPRRRINPEASLTSKQLLAERARLVTICRELEHVSLNVPEVNAAISELHQIGAQLGAIARARFLAAETKETV